jgi:hypothetical protein
MPIDISWLLENRVIHVHPSGVATLEEFAAVNDTIIQMIHQGVANGASAVHIFVNAIQLRQQPSPLEVRRVFTHTAEPGLGWSVVGGVGNPVIIFFTKIITSAAASKTRIFETPDQALDFLRRKDESLPDLLTIYQQMETHG